MTASPSHSPLLGRRSLSDGHLRNRITEFVPSFLPSSLDSIQFLKSGGVCQPQQPAQRSVGRGLGLIKDADSHLPLSLSLSPSLQLAVIHSVTAAAAAAAAAED